MAPSSTPAKSGSFRPFVWIAVVTLLLAAALSGAWYYLASQLDRAVRAGIETAAGEGVRIGCENQAVFGYPFRLGLRCDALDIDAPAKSFRADGGALRTAAQIYQPNRVVAELDGPLNVTAAGMPPFEVSWALAQSSTSFWTEGLDHFALVLEAPKIALHEPAGARQPLVQSEHVEVHARRRDQALDLALSDRAVKLLAPELAAVPVFDVTADLTVEGAADWLAGRRTGRTLGEALAGRSGEIRTLGIALAGTAGSVSVSGPFSVDDDRRISGDFAVAMANVDGIVALVSAAAPQFAGIAGSVASGIAFAGRTENGKTTMQITVRNGTASLGLIPLGKLPTLD
jgi:hypothetical protein